MTIQRAGFDSSSIAAIQKGAHIWCGEKISPGVAALCRGHTHRSRRRCCAGGVLGGFWDTRSLRDILSRCDDRRSPWWICRRHAGDGPFRPFGFASPAGAGWVPQHLRSCRFAEPDCVFHDWTILISLLAAIHRGRAGAKETEALRKYELLAAHSRDIILFIRSNDARILEASAAACTAYGYECEELLKLTIHGLRAPGAKEPTDDVIAEADAQGVLYERVHRRRDGGAFPVEVGLRGATIDGADVLICVVRDVTERKRAEEALRVALDRAEWLGRFPEEIPARRCECRATEACFTVIPRLPDCPAGRARPADRRRMLSFR